MLLEIREDLEKMEKMVKRVRGDFLVHQGQKGWQHSKVTKGFQEQEGPLVIPVRRGRGVTSGHPGVLVFRDCRVLLDQRAIEEFQDFQEKEVFLDLLAPLGREGHPDLRAKRAARANQGPREPLVQLVRRDHLVRPGRQAHPVQQEALGSLAPMDPPERRVRGEREENLVSQASQVRLEHLESQEEMERRESEERKDQRVLRVQLAPPVNRARGAL